MKYSTKCEQIIKKKEAIALSIRIFFEEFRHFLERHDLAVNLGVSLGPSSKLKTRSARLVKSSRNGSISGE